MILPGPSMKPSDVGKLLVGIIVFPASWKSTSRPLNTLNPLLSFLPCFCLTILPSVHFLQFVVFEVEFPCAENACHLDDFTTWQGKHVMFTDHSGYRKSEPQQWRQMTLQLVSQVQIWRSSITCQLQQNCIWAQKFPSRSNPCWSMLAASYRYTGQLQNRQVVKVFICRASAVAV